MRKHKKSKLEIHNFFRYPCMDLLEHILQPSQFLPLTPPYYPFSIAWKWELFMALLVTCGFISGTTDLWGCGHRIHSGGVGIPGPCSEGLVQGCDAGDLQEPAVSGWGWHPSRAAPGICIFPVCPLGGPDVFHLRVLVTRAWHSFTRLNWPASDAVSVSCHVWGCPRA